ncbi:thiamine phosphate synthase [Lederbergia lenta]|uniref:Thiamine-phosphate synthase n=1 Tax=Lederbergia lenta TaxID=1467 RepID=A0A2X4WEJ3_LEDLE|nr:thiamine phosphate synthase [Lederbergia lenta]MEC2324721.1 thiamine phosphate synthase [Lederbergia lenta]SQI58288.1 thiamine phosphate pyrophosphorylase [Lederbergia lenta]
MRNTYALNLVTEESVPLEKLLPIIEEAVKGGVTIVQLREKRSTGKCFYEKAKSVKALLDRYDVPLIINDRVDIALAVGAAGVHVGQDDLPLVAIRKMLPSSMIVGISTSTMEEAKEAEKNGASYIGVGSVFTTKSKADASLLPKGDLEKIAEAVSIPVVAIGGIGLDNMKLLPNNKIAGVAVVSAIMKSKNPYDAAVAFRKYLE